MNLVRRRLIYLSFFVVFLAAGSALLFYLQGYRYNSVKGKVQRTGGVVVNSMPVGASITLNGAGQPDVTPTSLQSLIPADYDVGVELPGFQPWRKTLNVKPSLVTFTGAIRLWPQPSTGERLTPAVNLALASPVGSNLLVYSPTGLNSGLWLYNLATGQGSLLSRFGGSTLVSLEWYRNGQQFLLGLKQGSLTHYQIFDLTSRAWEDVSLPSDLQPHAVHWGDDDDSLLVSSNDQLYQYSRRTGSAKLLWRVNLTDFRAHDGLIFGLTTGSGGALELRLLDLASLHNVTLPNLPTLSANVSWLQARGDWLPLFDQDRHSLYLLHSPLTEPSPLRQLPEGTSLDWSPDGERLLLTNNFEIWQYDITTDKLNLLTRVSTPLGRSRLVGSEPYALLSSGGQLWALEFDSRGQQQRWLLADYGNQIIDDLFLDPGAQSVVVKLGSGLWRLNLTLGAGG